MKTLTELDNNYIESLFYSTEQLKKAFECIKLDYEFDLNKKEISEAICRRLYTYNENQKAIKIFLHKQKATVSADFVVESVLYFLKLYFAKDTTYEICSEMPIEQNRGSMRPDISVFKNSELIATIECKTSLGWYRNDWEIDFERRCQILKEKFPRANSFLFIIQDPGKSEYLKKHQENPTKYFCLLDNSNQPKILTPIEKLIERLIEQSDTSSK